MKSTEWIAAALGLVNVGLVARRSIWNYPFGIVMVSLYFFVFLDARLYSDALLQIFFLLIQVFGWVNWSRSRTTSGEVMVGRLSNRSRMVWAGATLALSITWGAGMARFTDAAAPFLDSTIAGMSIAAQLLMSLRKIENWLVWILVDALAIGVFASRGLQATSVLYAVFLAMSVAGLIGWRRAELREVVQ